MSETTSAKQPVKKKPIARYFGGISKDDDKDVEHIPVDIKKKTKPFKGDVIRVDEKPKFFPKAKWSKEGKLHHIKKGNKPREVKIDPYALQKHSSECK